MVVRRMCPHVIANPMRLASHAPSKRICLHVAGALIILWSAACGDGGTGPAPAPAPNRAPVTSGPIEPQTVAVGETVTVNAAGHFTDPDGDALTFTAASSNDAIASVAVAGSEVTVTAAARGGATVTVTARDPGGLSAQLTFAVTVPNQPPAAVDTIPGRLVEAGDTVTVDVSSFFDDPDGDTLSYAATSSDTVVATAKVADNTLTVGGASAGIATITVTATDPGQLGARLSFQVTVEADVVILEIEPAVLVEGAEARITGSGFSAKAARNRVSVGGRLARMTAATPTSLTIMVPAADCLPPRREGLRVEVGSRSNTQTVGVTPRSLETEPGSSWYTSAGNGCLHLAGNASGGEYLIGVVSISQDPASLTDVTLTGTPWDSSAVGAEGGRIVGAAERGAVEEVGLGALEALTQGPFSLPAALDPRPGSRMAGASVGGLSIESLAADTLRMRRVRAHNEIMARNQALLRRLGRANRPAAADARSDLEVGDTLGVYAGYARKCEHPAQAVRAVVRLVGKSSIWLDDLDNPAETFTDTELASLDALYSAHGKGVLDDYFGELSDVDGNGRFLVLMTKEVNRNSLAGFVWSGDVYPRRTCPTSNEAEIFYGMVPDPQGSVADPVTRQALLAQYPALIAHEVTHLVQFNAHVYGNAADRGWKVSWEFEGGATLAEQLVGYRVLGHGSGQELDLSAFSPWEERGQWYGDWYVETALFFGWDFRGDGYGRIPGAPEECSWVGRPNEGNSGPCLLGVRAIYGVPSTVFRYAMDRWGGDYPGGERALMRRLTQSPARGFASLMDVSPKRSWRPEQILADFYITLWIDLQGGKAQGMTSWDLHDIFSKSRENLRLQPHTSSSPAPHLAGRRIRAGSSLYFHWTPTGTLNPTSIRVTSPGGERLPDHISVWALRVR